MSRVKLTIATTDYDHFRDFRLGITNAEGIDHTWLTLGHHEVFARFTFNREWDVSELSFAKFCAQVTRPTPDIIGLPVVCSRLFRFSSFYVNRHSKIKTVADLKGKTIGSPEWAHTAAVYMRGWLNDEHGIGLHDVHWYQAGANEAGRIEKVELNLPKGVKLTRVNDKSLSEMIATGEIDCALIARPPNSFLQGNPDGGELLRADEGLADHAHHCDPDPGAGRASLGRPQPLQCLRRVEAPQHRASA
jgi:4,5-dihydroxyphthalate decarboxylase